MLEIRYVQLEDEEFWYSLDGYLPKQEFVNKVDNKRGYEITRIWQPMEMFFIKGI